MTNGATTSLRVRFYRTQFVGLRGLGSRCNLWRQWFRIELRFLLENGRLYIFGYRQCQSGYTMPGHFIRVVNKWKRGLLIKSTR